MPTADEFLPPNGENLRRALEALVTTLNDRGVRYAIIGGLAMVQHTRVRTTEEVNALLTVPRVAVPGLLEAMRDRGFEVDVETCIRELSDGGFTCVRFAGVLVDLLLPITPAHAHVLDRAITAEILGRKVPISSAEGLIVLKLTAMRPQDEADIHDLLAAYGPTLDLHFIRRELESFTEPDDPRRASFERWVATLLPGC